MHKTQHSKSMKNAGKAGYPPALSPSPTDAPPGTPTVGSYLQRQAVHVT